MKITKSKIGGLSVTVIEGADANPYPGETIHRWRKHGETWCGIAIVKGVRAAMFGDMSDVNCEVCINKHLGI